MEITKRKPKTTSGKFNLPEGKWWDESHRRYWWGKPHAIYSRFRNEAYIYIGKDLVLQVPEVFSQRQANAELKSLIGEVLILTERR
jgi:hypothetical protein